MQRKNTAAPDQHARLIADMQAKQQRQRNEIGRLERLVAQLQADKAALRHDLTKAKTRADQLAAIIQGGIA